MCSDPNPRVPPADMTSLVLIKNRSDLDRTSRGTFGLNTLKNAWKSSFWTSSGRTWHLDRSPWTSTEDELALPLLTLSLSHSLSLSRSLFCVLLPGDRQAAVCFVGGVYDYEACSESFKMDEKLWTTHCIHQRPVGAECIEFSHPSWQVPLDFGRVIRIVIAIVRWDSRRDHCGQNVRTHIRQTFPNVPNTWNSPVSLFQGKFEGS